jgi:hypothetical protein
MKHNLVKKSESTAATIVAGSLIERAKELQHPDRN